MTAPVAYVVQADTTVTWGGEFFVAARTVVDIVPGSPLYNAYGGASNLVPLAPTQQPDVADHAETGN